MPNYDTMNQSVTQEFYDSPKARELNWYPLLISPNYKMQVTEKTLLTQATLTSQLKYHLDRLLEEFPDPGFVDYGVGVDKTILVRVYDVATFNNNLKYIYGTSGYFINPTKYITQKSIKMVEKPEQNQWGTLQKGEIVSATTIALDQKIAELLTTGTLKDIKGNELVDEIDTHLVVAKDRNYIYAEICNFKIHPYNPAASTSDDAGVLLRFSGRQTSGQIESIGWDVELTFSVNQFKGVAPADEFESSGFSIKGLTITENPLFWPNISTGGTEESGAINSEKISAIKELMLKNIDGDVKAFLLKAKEDKNRVPLTGYKPEIVQKGKTTKKINPIPPYNDLINRPPRPYATETEEGSSAISEEDVFTAADEAGIIQEEQDVSAPETWTELEQQLQQPTGTSKEEPQYEITDMGLRYNHLGVVSGFYSIETREGIRVPSQDIPLSPVGVTYVEDLLTASGTESIQKKIDFIHQKLLSIDLAKQKQYPIIKGSPQTTISEPEDEQSLDEDENVYSRGSVVAKGGERSIVDIYEIDFEKYSKSFSKYVENIEKQ